MFHQILTPSKSDDSPKSHYQLLNISLGRIVRSHLSLRLYLLLYIAEIDTFTFLELPSILTRQEKYSLIPVEKADQ